MLIWFTGWLLADTRVKTGSNMPTISLTNGRICFVDFEDYETLRSIKWTYTQNGSNGYAVNGAKKKRVYMHRLIINAQPGERVDHINGDGLDNRRYNLRICSRSTNNRNRRGVKGYSRHISRYTTQDGKVREVIGWVAETKLEGKRIRRYFASEDQAKEFASTFVR